MRTVLIARKSGLRPKPHQGALPLGGVWGEAPAFLATSTVLSP